MGNQHAKLQTQTQSGRPKKMVHWKSAERPSPPGRPTLIPLSDQQPDVVNLRWDRPRHDGGSPITGYVVEHRRMGSPHWVRATPTPVSRCECSISGLEPGWRYQFRAIAENVVGRSDPSELSDPLTVTLQRNAISVPRFVDELKETLAVEDERIEFHVRVMGQPMPEINWFKDGYEIFSSRRTKIVNDNDVSVLIFHQVALTDEGEIKCTATNRAGHVVTKAKLLVQAPPKIRLPRTYEDGLIVEADEVLRLKVGIAGQPAPSVTWMHEGEAISNGGRYEIVDTDRNSLLKIDSVQRDDRGEYSIKAVNKLGEDVTSFLVTVTARPNPPGKVRLNMSFGKSATLSWTAPIDDGGCKIGNYIVEYFRIGWNVWLKAATTRSLSTTLHDLIEGSEYKFRVKAENPYGISDPSEESDVLFIPDPKRGITKPKSEGQLADNDEKPVPPVRKTLSPTRPSQQNADTSRVSPNLARREKPQLLDSADLHLEMSYGMPDQVLRKDMRRSPLLNTAENATPSSKPSPKLKVETGTQATTRSPQRSPNVETARPQQLLRQATPPKEKSPSPQIPPPRPPPPVVPYIPEPEPEIPSPSPEVRRATLHRKRSLSPPKSGVEATRHHQMPRTPTPPEQLKATPALQRSAEPVQLGVNQHVRRFSSHGLSPAKNVPSLAIAIASGFNATATPSDGNTPPKVVEKQNASTITNPTIQISAPPPPPPPERTSIPNTILESKKSPSPLRHIEPARSPTRAPLSLGSTDKQDDVHTSNEFMLVVFDKNSKVKDKNKEDSFELDLEDALQPPPISISSPDLASLEFTNLHTFPLRRSVSSTELLYERAMARFYEAVELEEAEKVRKLKMSQDKIAAPANVQPTTVRKRLGSMTETERLSFERRSELRRQSADAAGDLKSSLKWSSRENISTLKSLSRTTGTLRPKRQDSEESTEFSDYPAPAAPNKNDSYDLGSDYTESTASSEDDSIEKFKMELMARTRSPSPRELETYHPRNMSAGVFTPYRAPTPDNAAVVLTRPMPLPDPDFVPKPILKRPSNENVVQPESTPMAPSNNNNNPNEKIDIAKGIKSFFKRDKRSTTEKNTEENQVVLQTKETPTTSASAPAATAASTAAEAEVKRRAKEEEERKRKEAERLMLEEAHAAVDHYSDLVQQVSQTRKYHKPLYLDQDELKKAVEKAAHEDIAAGDNHTNMVDHMKSRRSQSPDIGLIPPISNKPRLSISERGQMIHVRETGSNLAFTEPTKSKAPETPSEDSGTSFPSESNPQSDTATVAAAAAAVANTTATTTTVVSETREERPDSRGRTRIVKVKRIIKKRVPSSTRSRDTSTSRPPSSVASTQDIAHNLALEQEFARNRGSHSRPGPGSSKSPGPLGRRPLTQAPVPDIYAGRNDETNKALAIPTTVPPNDVTDLRLADHQLSEEAQEKVRSALSYTTDLVLFVVACYVYLFKDARLVLPILALMIYRQLGEAINRYIPNWMRRKKN